jgi:D-3-phosphoglycerate dehydrogenase
MDQLFEQSDLISLHLPLTKDTENLLNDTTFEKMKKGVRLICAARGGIINENALVNALNSGKVAGAALDVFENEPPGLTDLVTHKNVVATPHIGAQTAEAQVRAAKDIAEEILNALEDKPLRWQIV